MKESTFVKKRHIKTTRKVLGVVKNDITGIEYGLIEIPTTAEIIVPSQKNKKIKNNKKHNSAKNTRIKTDSVEKETKSANQQKTKRRYRVRATVMYSYNFKNSPKPVDLTKKNFKKKKDLFKKKQRNEKIALQNLAQQFINIEPVMDLIVFDTIEALNSIKQKTR